MFEIYIFKILKARLFIIGGHSLKHACQHLKVTIKLTKYFLSYKLKVIKNSCIFMYLLLHMGNKTVLICLKERQNIYKIT